MRRALLTGIAVLIVGAWVAPAIGLTGPDRDFVSLTTMTPLTSAASIDFPLHLWASVKVSVAPDEEPPQDPADNSVDDPSDDPADDGSVDVPSDDASGDTVSSDDPSEEDPEDDGSEVSADDGSGDDGSADDPSSDDRKKGNGPKDKLFLHARLTLDGSSDGIDPLTEDVGLQLDGVTFLIGPGEFKLKGRKYHFVDRGPDGRIAIRLLPSKKSARWKLVVKTEGYDLSLIDNPVLVSLVIGNDGGSVEVNAKIVTKG